MHIEGISLFLGEYLQDMRTGERIAALRKARGLSQSQLAKLAGLSQATIGKLESGISSGSSHIHKIARALGTTPAYLMGETDNPSEGFVPAPTADMVAADLELVQVKELDLAYGMGATFLDVPVEDETHLFPRKWLRHYSHTAPDQLVFIQGIGDSMDPTVRDSDTLLIDCSVVEMTVSDKIWACKYSGMGMVKRLRKTADGILVMSDNPAVRPFTAGEGELQLFGRVVGVFRKV